MDKEDIQHLLRLLQGQRFETAKMESRTELKQFTSQSELIEWLEQNDPKVGSFILLEGGAWIEWNVISVTYEYVFVWQLLKRPEL